MNYRAIGNKCAVILKMLDLPITDDRALEILKEKRFTIKETDIIKSARTCIENSIYRRGAKLFEAPAVFDCSSFVKFLYAQLGIWIPRRSIQQREFGKVILLKDAQVGDLIFTSGQIDYFIDDKSDGVGHVGILTDTNTVIHAANTEKGVIETPLTEFVSKEKFRGVRRYIPDNSKLITLIIPPDKEVETSDDIKWIILQSLKP